MAAETLCLRLGAALAGVRPAAMPAEVLHGAKRALLDALGAALAGCGTTEVDGVLAAARAWGGQGPARAWGTDERLSAPHAALVNGTAVHAREVDDFGGCGHSGAVVVPSVLAAAELRDRSGPDVLAAIVVGYEAAARLTEFAGGYPAHNEAGWHSTGTCGVFGAAAGAARVLGLDAERTAQALALSGTYTGGIWSFIVDGAMSKRLHAGKAAEGGLVAALLARQGMTGPLHLFETGWGSFRDLYAPGRARPEGILPNFEREFLIFRSGFKPYACCRGCHSALDAVLDLRARHGFGEADVARVTVTGPEQAVRQLGKQRVENVLDAQMSLPYSIAVALRFGRADLVHYQPPHLADPTLAGLSARVAVVADPAQAVGSQPRVAVELRDGRRVAAHVERPKGEHANPMSDDELQAKFMALATLWVSAGRAAALAEAVWTLDRAGSMRDLIALLGREEGGRGRHDAFHPAPAGGGRAAAVGRDRGELRDHPPRAG